MRSLTAFVDEMAMAGDFITGQVVRKTGLRDFMLSPYVGRVVYANPRTGKVTVQWPWGAEQESPVELVRDASEDLVPPLATHQLYPSYESEYHQNDTEHLKSIDKWRKTLASRIAARYNRIKMLEHIVTRYEERTKPIWRAACKAWHQKVSEIAAFQAIAVNFEPEFGTDAVRLTIANLYDLGRKLAIYYKDNNRRYKVTNREKASGKFTCPRCKTVLKPRTYRQGKKILLCQSCGFSISPKDLVHPGEPAQTDEQASVEIL